MLNNENVKNGLQVAGVIAKKVLGAVGPLIVARVLLGNPFDNKTAIGSDKASYNDAISAILNSSMWAEDKSKAVSALKMDMKPEIYKAITDVAKTPMFSEDKRDTIIKMVNREEV